MNNHYSDTLPLEITNYHSTMAGFIQANERKTNMGEL